MAKTRSQTKHQREMPQRPNLSRNLKHKKTMKKSNLPAVIKNCSIKLTKIDVHRIDWNRFDIKQIDLSKIHLGFPKVEQALGQKKTGCKGYNLRKIATPKPEPILKPASKSMNKIVASSNVALYTSRAIRMWEALKKHNKVEIKENDTVCARMAGHRPWPSKVLQFKTNGVLMKFHGTGEIGLVKKAEILPINLCQDVIDEYLKIPRIGLSSKTLLYHMSFIKAAKEISCINLR